MTPRVYSKDLQLVISSIPYTMRTLAESGMTMLVVTHEMNFAKNVSSKVVFMEGGVVVEESDPTAFFQNPKQERARAFLKTILGEERKE